MLNGIPCVSSVLVLPKHFIITSLTFCNLIFLSDQQKYDEDQKIVLDEYLMESMLCMLVPHTHSLTDQVCKPVSIYASGNECNSTALQEIQTYTCIALAVVRGHLAC